MGLGSALKGAGPATALPPWGSLADIVRPHQGELGIIHGMPNAGKSPFAFAWSFGINKPVLYVSLDTALELQALRACAYLYGASHEEVEKDPEKWIDLLNREHPLVQFTDHSPLAEDFGDLLEAYREFFGQVPEMVVVDDVTWVMDRSVDENKATNDAFHQLHKAAREYGTFILAIHHIKKPLEGKVRPNLWAGKYGGEFEAQIILFLNRENDTVMKVHVTKNRRGQADPNGGLVVPLRIHASRFSYSDIYGPQESWTDV